MEKSVDILQLLASSMGRRDEVPNQILAEKIATDEDVTAIEVLAENLSNKDRLMSNDCIKVLYEIGTIKPELIAKYVDIFLTLLSSKNNRLQWGAMTAINCIASVAPEVVYQHLQNILAAADKGSVITRDQAVNILIKLAILPKYAESAFSLVIEQLQQCPVNQLPMYAERTSSIVDTENRDVFIETLESRFLDVSKESQQRRLNKVIRKVNR